jgi:hypothetical protein
MTHECDKIRVWLDDPALEPLAPDLRAHAAACEACGRAVALETAMRAGLGAAAELDADHQGMLLDRIAPVAATSHIARRRWPWAAGVAAAAAAVVLGIVIFRPEQRQPISPTEVFGDLVGPLADFSPPPPQVAAPADTNPVPFRKVLAAFFSDLETPINVGLGALGTPQPAAGAKPAASPGNAPPPPMKKEG